MDLLLMVKYYAKDVTIQRVTNSQKTIINPKIRYMNKNKVKLLFEVEYDEDNIIKESVWAIKLDNGNYQIDNIPFYAYCYADEDIVTAEENADQLYVQDLVKPSGNSTSRILFQNNDNVVETRNLLKKMGCNSKVSNVDSLIAVSVSLNINYKDVKHFLDEGENEDRWEYEEACLSEKHQEDLL